MILKKYSKRYEDDVISLLNVCFDGKNITRTSFEWKHFDRYFRKKETSYIALDNQELCSFVCFTPIEIETNVKKLEFCSCSVQATHPKYRRLGIVSKLTQLIETDLGSSVDYLGFSNNSGLQIDLHSKKINYQILGQMITTYMSCLPQSSNISINEVSCFNKSFFHLRKSVKYEIFRDLDYIDWRYYRNPKNTFSYLEIVENTKVIGIAVVRNSFYRCEILCVVPLDLEYLSVCFSSIRSYAFFKGLAAVSFAYLPNRVWNQSLPKHRIQRNSEIYFTVKSEKEDFLSSENWMIQGGDVQ